MWPRFCLQITSTSELIFRTAMSFCPDEGTAVEFAFGLHNPNSEFEGDILKCILAIEDGCKVRKLILIGKPGAIARLCAPAPKAIVALVGKRFNLAVEVLELRVSQHREAGSPA